MFEKVGSFVQGQFIQLGEVSSLGMRFLRSIFSTYKLFPKFIEQVYQLGVKSLPATLVTAIFIGMAFTLQIIREFVKFGALQMVGGIVGLAIWRELGPLLTGVVVSGRIGAAIASEIGTMKVTEQIDALKALSQDPIKYLVVPRILAVMFMMPLLVGIADVAGFLSGFGVATLMGNINPYAYFNSASLMLQPADVYGGLIKAFVFGFIIALISCYQGLKTTAGAKGVGQSTTFAVVASLIAIFIINYFLSLVLF